MNNPAFGVAMNSTNAPHALWKSATEVNAAVHDAREEYLAHIELQIPTLPTLRVG